MKKTTRKVGSAKKRIPAKNVDDYLAAVPEPARATLEALRKIIKSAAPGAEEAISYQIPTFRYHGSLVGFAAFPNHCSFFIMSPKLMAEHKDELKAYETATATIHFPTDKPLPAALVKKFVQARIEENEARRKPKASRSDAKRSPKRKGPSRTPHVNK